MWVDRVWEILGAISHVPTNWMPCTEQGTGAPMCTLCMDKRMPYAVWQLAVPGKVLQGSEPLGVWGPVCAAVVEQPAAVAA